VDKRGDADNVEGAGKNAAILYCFEYCTVSLPVCPVHRAVNPSSKRLPNTQPAATLSCAYVPTDRVSSVQKPSVSTSLTLSQLQGYK